MKITEKTAEMKIDLTDEKNLNQLGLSAQMKISKLSDTMLANVRTEKMDRIIKKINQTIDYIDSLCQLEVDKASSLQADKYGSETNVTYKDAERRIDNMASELKEYQQNLLKNRAFLEMLEKLNRNHYKELEVAYNLGREGLRQIEERLEQMQVSDTDEKSAGDYLKLREQRKRIDDRLQELSISREISYQISMELRLLQENDSNVSSKIQEVLLKTIMLWKKQIGIVLEKGIVNEQDKKELLKNNMNLRENFKNLVIDY